MSINALLSPLSLSLAGPMLGRAAMEHRETGTRWSHLLGHGLAASAAFGALISLEHTTGSIALIALTLGWAVVDPLVALATAVVLGLVGALLSAASMVLLAALAIAGLGLSVASHSVYRDLRSAHLPTPAGGRWLRELLEVLIGWPGHVLLTLAHHGYRPSLARAVEAAGRMRFAPAPNARWRNWSGTHRCRTRAILYAASVDDVVAAVQQARREGCRLRVVGVGYSWSPLIPTDGIILSTSLLDHVELDLSDPDNPRATVGPGATSRDLNRKLEPLGLAVTSSVVMETVSWGGMVGVSAHGSGRHERPVSDLVEAVQLVDSRGRVRIFRRHSDGDDDDVMATVCGALGTCGVITSITLRVTRAGPVRYRDTWLPLDQVPTHMAALTLGHDYTDLYWFPSMDRVWVRTWDHAPAGTAMQAVPGWSGRSNRGHYALWISSALVAMGPLKDLLSRFLPDPLARGVLALQGDLAVGTSVDVCTHINNATHFRGGIELYRVGCIEFAVPVGEQFRARNPSLASGRRTLRGLGHTRLPADDRDPQRPLRSRQPMLPVPGPRR